MLINCYNIDITPTKDSLLTLAQMEFACLKSAGGWSKSCKMMVSLVRFPLRIFSQRLRYCRDSDVDSRYMWNNMLSILSPVCYYKNSNFDRDSTCNVFSKARPDFFHSLNVFLIHPLNAIHQLSILFSCKIVLPQLSFVIFSEVTNVVHWF